MTKEQIIIELEKNVNAVIEQQKNGDINLLDAVLHLRYFKDMFEEILDKVKTFESDNLNEIALASQDYNGSYQGFNFVAITKKGNMNYKGIAEIEQKEKELKSLKDTYKSAYDGVLKGSTVTEEVDGVKMWINSDGELLPLPKQDKGSSYLTLKSAK